MQQKEVTMQNDTPDKAGVIAPPPLLYGTALMFGLLVHL